MYTDETVLVFKQSHFVEDLVATVTSLSDTPACNTMMFKLWNTGILASYR
jgi:hypothetical protein